MGSRGVKRTAAIAGVAAVALGVVGWQGVRWLDADAAPAATVRQPVPASAPRPAESPDGDVVTVDQSGDAAVDAGTTPMRERVAVIGLLNKRNGVSRDLTLKPGQAVRVGDTVVRLRACEQTAPWEQDALTGAFVQLDVQQVDKSWKRAFSGWLFKERPALNVVLHPVYDVWAKSCAMTFPDKGADTVSIAAPAARSTAAKSADGSAEVEVPTTPDSAVDNSAR